ncbi:MAG: dicarboxylate/amino acid:cation symporter [Anaerolineae bacterium]|nr:dicarboxylate/amino acid:cation symporter [Gloeobacterales cyanobacterium ES-bin-313]
MHSLENDPNRPIWQRIPLYIQILIALIIGVGVGVLFGAGQPTPENATFLQSLAIPCSLILKALRALATPLILLAVLHSFLTAEIPENSGRRLFFYLLTNTLVAILVGLLVANVLQPGHWGQLPAPQGAEASKKTLDPWALLQDSVPTAIVQPLVDNNVIQLIVVALAFGIALRKVKAQQIAEGRSDYLPGEQVVGFLFEAVMRVLSWVIALVPLAVFGVVARTVGISGFAPFKALGALIVAVITALVIQACYYLLRVRLSTWVGIRRFLGGGSDALWTAFSTASSTVTMPVTFRVLIEKVGLRESSTALGAMVGSNFNNDGTALYEAMAALFIAQTLNINLSIGQQLIVVFTSIVASVGAAGIPEAGLVTMTLVFSAVGLPTEYIALLVTVDWFLDRCRTSINVMGDMTVSALLDGKVPKSEIEVEEVTLEVGSGR